MQLRVKYFTYSSNAGATVIQSELQDHINDWLRQTPGRVVQVTQSECELQRMAHTTVGIWYEPAAEPAT